jgi:hypothetical protein
MVPVSILELPMNLLVDMLEVEAILDTLVVIIKIICGLNDKKR